MAKKLNRWVKKFISKQGFTLVELIIVIAIIAVLAVAAFMLLTKWLANSRDSRRMWDLNTIKSSLSIHQSDIDFNPMGHLPFPDNRVAIEDSDTNEMWYQWYFGTGVVSKMDNLNKGIVDPSNTGYYRYATTLDAKEYQVMVMLEKGEEASFIFDDVYASNTVAEIDGLYDGYVWYALSGSDDVRIVQTPSLFLLTGTEVSVLSGPTSQFFVDGESKNTPSTIANLQFDPENLPEDLTNQAVATFGLESPSFASVIINENSSANVVVEAEAGTGSGWSSAPTNSELCTFGNIILDNTNEWNCVLQ